MVRCGGAATSETARSELRSAATGSGAAVEPRTSRARDNDSSQPGCMAVLRAERNEREQRALTENIAAAATAKVPEHLAVLSFTGSLRSHQGRNHTANYRVP